MVWNTAIGDEAFTQPQRGLLIQRLEAEHFITIQQGAVLLLLDGQHL